MAGIKFVCVQVQFTVMDRKTTVLVLILLAIVSLGYAVYRSTAVRMTLLQNGQPTVYGEPQHGLLLGLCVFAGICLWSAVWLSERPVDVIRRDREERQDFSRRPLS